MHELLVIGPQACAADFERLRQFKQDTGIRRKVVTREDVDVVPGSDAPDRVKRRIELEHRIDRITHISLVGDADEFPVRYIKATNTECQSFVSLHDEIAAVLDEVNEAVRRSLPGQTTFRVPSEYSVPVLSKPAESVSDEASTSQPTNDVTGAHGGRVPQSERRDDLSSGAVAAPVERDIKSIKPPEWTAPMRLRRSRAILPTVKVSPQRGVIAHPRYYPDVWPAYYLLCQLAAILDKERNNERISRQ
ncbi:MAG: hypothetical protein GY926_08180 [bacterium]|nr:hypothetical protein [bacterium]